MRNKVTTLKYWITWKAPMTLGWIIFVVCWTMALILLHYCVK